MKIRMLMDVSGTFHNQEGVKRGDVVDVDNDSGENYIRLGYAEKDTGKTNDGSELLQVAKRSTEYITAEDSNAKEVEAVVDEAEAVNTPAPKVITDPGIGKTRSTDAETPYEAVVAGSTGSVGGQGTSADPAEKATKRSSGSKSK